MRREDTTEITARCFHGDPASCSHPCPFFFDVRTFLKRAMNGKWGLAYKLYRNAVVFPGIVSEICEAPCRAECQRGSGDRVLDCAPVALSGAGYFVGDEAVDIRAVEAAAVRFARDRTPESFRIAPKEQKIAVVGAGLAGLSFALNMAQKAYSVTVFEREGRALDGWRDHPKYEVFLEEIRLQFSTVGVEFVFGREIAGPEDAELEGFAAVYFATGADGVSGLNAAQFAPRLNSCSDFAGGGMIGQDAVSSIAYGIEMSREIEAWLQTGERLSQAAERPDKHYLDHSGEIRKPLVEPADPDSGYTKEEAALEASRCLGCDCRLCLDSCKMLGYYNKRPQKIAIEAYSDTKAAPPFSSCTLTRETYSCNLCGHCRSVCPLDIDMEKVFFLARAGRAETEKQPKAFHDFWLNDFEWHRSEGSYYSPSRQEKAVAVCKEKPMVFFPGCKLGGYLADIVRGAAEFLKEEFGADVLLNCCGAPAYWAGEEKLFRQHLDSIREEWASYGKPVFVMACIYCMRLFKEFLPEIEVLSIYEVLVGQNRPLLSEPSHSVLAVFDPCTARDFPEAGKAVRRLAAKAGLDLIELPEKNLCCGYGGHMRVANPGLYDTIVDHRAGASEAPYLVYCANCAETFSIEGKANTHILDLFFSDTRYVPFCLRETEKNRPYYVTSRPFLSLQQKRDNAVRTKSALMELYEGKAFAPASLPWDDIKVSIPTELLAKLDRLLIMETDIKEAIYEAERKDNVFVLADGNENGEELRQCFLVRDVVTIWVQYKVNKASGYDYSITETWSHRMRFVSDE